MRAWKRMLLSLGSFVAASLTLGAGFALYDLRLPGALQYALTVASYSTVLGLPGWLISLPLILWARRPSWPSSLYDLGIGTVLGPLWIAILAVGMAHWNKSFGLKLDGISLFLLSSLWVAFLSTSIYLLLLRRFSSGSIQSTS